jgi:hypothetical protein
MARARPRSSVTPLLPVGYWTQDRMDALGARAQYETPRTAMQDELNALSTGPLCGLCSVLTDWCIQGIGCAQGSEA